MAHTKAALMTMGMEYPLDKRVPLMNLDLSLSFSG
jgi:hypothetical protein